MERETTGACRLTRAEKARIRAAVAVLESSFSDFTREAALKAADTILRQHLNKHDAPLEVPHG
jgi:uncharacterized protein (DUF1778 family)